MGEKTNIELAEQARVLEGKAVRQDAVDFDPLFIKPVVHVAVTLRRVARAAGWEDVSGRGFATSHDRHDMIPRISRRVAAVRTQAIKQGQKEVGPVGWNCRYVTLSEVNAGLHPGAKIRITLVSFVAILIDARPTQPNAYGLIILAPVSAHATPSLANSPVLQPFNSQGAGCSAVATSTPRRPAAAATLVSTESAQWSPLFAFCAKPKAGCTNQKHLLKTAAESLRGRLQCAPFTSHEEDYTSWA